MLTVAVPLGGRIVTVHLHQGGIACVYDPLAGGWELRKLAEDGTTLGNMAAKMPVYSQDLRHWVHR